MATGKQRFNYYFILIVVIAVYVVIFSLLSIRNHDLYQTFGWDLGFFDQLIWQASRGRVNFVSTIGNINILGDHFQPVLYLLAPLYWIWDDVRVLLVAQAFLVASAGIPLYLLAKKKLGHGFIGLAVVAAYLLFPGTQFTITNEFHQSAFTPLFLSLGLYWIETGRERKGLAALLGLLLIKEELALLVAALGLMYLLIRRFKLGLVLLVVGVASFFLLVNVIIPAVSSQGQYIHYGYGEIGSTPEGVVDYAINNPLDIVDRMINPKIKRNQVRSSLLSFGGLPLLSPIYLIPVSQQYAIRFLDDRNVHRWLDRNHYAAPLGPLLAVGMISSAGWILSKVGKNRRTTTLWGLTAYILLVPVGLNLLIRTPILAIAKPQLYYTPEWVKNVDEAIGEIPEDVWVAANNSIVPHLSHRDKVYLFPKEVGDAEYIVIDLNDGPNKYAPWGYNRTVDKLNEITKEGWQEYRRVGQTQVFKRD